MDFYHPDSPRLEWSNWLMGGQAEGTSVLTSPRLTNRPERTPPVFCVWDMESCPFPSQIPVYAIVQKIAALAAQHGQPERPVALCKQGMLSAETSEQLSDSQVLVEEVASEDSEAVPIYMSTQLLSMSLKLSQELKSSLGGKEDRHGRGASIIVISSNNHLAQALTILRRCGLFSMVLLLHMPNASRQLTNAATTAAEWTSFLGFSQADFTSHALPKFGERSERASSQPVGASSHQKMISAPSSSFSSPGLQGVSLSSSSKIIDDATILGPMNGLSLSGSPKPKSLSSEWRTPPRESQNYSFGRNVDSGSNLRQPLEAYTSYLARTLDSHRPSGGSAKSHTRELSPTSMRSASFPSISFLESQAPGSSSAPVRSPRVSGEPSPSSVGSTLSPSSSSSLLRGREFGSQAFFRFPGDSASPFEKKWDRDRRNSAPTLAVPSSPSSIFGNDRNVASPQLSSPSLHSSPQSSTAPSPRGSPATPRSRTLNAYRERIAAANNLSREGGSLEARPALTPLNGSTESKLSSWRETDRLQKLKKTPVLQRTKKTALLLFSKVIDECKQERIIPRESVVRSRVENNVLPKSKKLRVAEMDNIKVPLRFDSWVETLVESGACSIEGARPQRVLWPVTGKFECADYFRPEERLNSDQTQEVLNWFRRERPQVDRGRYGLASYMKLKGPSFIQKLPRGYIVELVQLLLNKHVLVFRKGKVGYSPMGIDNPPDRDALPSSTGSMIEGPPLPSTIRRAMGRLLVNVPQFAEEITDDPMGVLGFLCAHSQPENHPSLAYKPMYHFEKSGLLHAPLWVCNVTVRIPGLPVSAGNQAAWGESQKSIIRVKRFKSEQKPRKGECMQEAAVCALKAHFWLFAFNLVCAEIPDAVRKMREEEQFESGSGDWPQLAIPNAEEEADEPEKPILPDAVGGPVVSPVELGARRELIQAVLEGKSSQYRLQDPVFVLDQVLVALDQKPVVYEINREVNRSDPSATYYACTVELQLRTRSNLFLFMGEAVNETGVSFPLCKVSTRSTKLALVKVEAANRLLIQMRQGLQRSPICFQERKRLA